jgi:hypothetical protein
LHQVIFPPKRGSEGALPDPGIQFPGGVVLKLRWSSFVGDRINVSVPLTPDFQVSESPFYKSEKMQPISKLEEFTYTAINCSFLLWLFHSLITQLKQINNSIGICGDISSRLKPGRI